MDTNSITLVPNIQTPPDSGERKALRRYYFRLAFIVLALIVVFNGISTITLYSSAAIIGGGFDEAALEAGKAAIRQNAVMSAIYSYLFPLAADIAAFGAGLAITRLDLRRKLRFTGFTGKELCEFTACSFGGALIGSVLMMITLVVIAVVYFAAKGLPSDINEILDSISGASSIVRGSNPLWLDILIYLYICVLGPVMEELVFRGVLLEGLRKYGNRFGIIMSGILFGLFHQNYLQFIPAMVMGIIFAEMAVRSESLLPSIFVHILNNCMSSILLVYMNTVDLSELTDAVDNPEALLSALTPEITSYIVLVSFNGLFRIVCLGAAIYFVVNYFSRGGKLVPENEYSRKRTWSFLFTSIPWLLVIFVLLYSTFTSISFLT